MSNKFCQANTEAKWFQKKRTFISIRLAEDQQSDNLVHHKVDENQGSSVANKDRIIRRETASNNHPSSVDSKDKSKYEKTCICQGPSAVGKGKSYECVNAQYMNIVILTWHRRILGEAVRIFGAV